MPSYTLPFEKPIVELESKLRDLLQFGETHKMDVSEEVDKTRRKIDETKREIYGALTPWQRVQMARHPLRPYTMDYIQHMCTDFIELHGDRIHRDDRAIIGGMARIDGQAVMVIGTQKGRDTKSNLECNFGCAYPEGYRKALRLMKLAAKYRVPILTLVDTPGAFPGIESEERHIAEAIAVNLREMFTFPVPIVVTVIGEGGSGGALGIGVGDRVLVLENGYYSVISPEGCAAILWKNRSFADRAASALKLTSADLLSMGLADEIVAEPLGGAHNDPAAIAATLKAALVRNLKELQALPADQLLAKRYEKFRAHGRFTTGAAPAPEAPRKRPRAKKKPAAATAEPATPAAES